MPKSFICYAEYATPRQPVLRSSGFIRAVAALLFLAGCTHDVGVIPIPVQKVPVAPVVPVASIEVLPYPLSLSSGTGTLTAVLRDSSGFILLGRTVVWSSADTTIATVSNTGVVTGHVAGQTTITATSEGVKGSVPVVVPSQPSVASILVTPDSLSVEVRQTWQLSLSLLDSIGRYTLPSGPVVWTTSDSTRAFVIGNGVVSAVGVGTAIITATNSGKSGHSTVRVFPTLPVGSITLSPDTITVQTGGITTYTFIVKDSLGNRVFTRPLTWSTSNSAQAVVLTQTPFEATVSALAPGTVTVIASSGGKQGTATMRIVPPPAVASLTVTPAAASVPVGRSLLLTSTAVDFTGTQIFPATTWVSSDFAKATVSFGTVTAVAPGTVIITATAGGKLAQATITVTPFVPLSLLAVAAGREDACGITDTGAAWCWGQDFFGARGDGASPDTLAHAIPGRVSSAATFTSISVGDYHTCAVSSTNDAYCWGFNSRGQLGVGAPGPICIRYGGQALCSAVPVPVSGGLSVRSISAGATSTCAVTTSNLGYCWGENTNGQLGTNSTAASAVPVAVAGAYPFTSIKVGRSHACALASDGRAYCWGSNSTGQLGAKTASTCTDTFGQITACSTIPLPVASAGQLYVAISVGGDHSCALTSDGSAYCWGSNASGELGIGSQTVTDIPSLVAGGRHFTALSAGDSHTCGITAAGTYCWGSNVARQLGIGIFSALSATPVLVTGGFAFESISTGTFQSCGVVSRVAYCWGSNNLGGLGTGDTKSYPSPQIAVTTP